MNIIKMAVGGAKKGLRAVAKKSPVLLAGAAVAGVVGVAVAAVKAGPKIKEAFDTKNEDLEDVELQVKGEEITDEEAKKLKKEIIVKFIKDLAITSLPVIISAGLTIACILGLNAVHLKKQAALTALVTIAEGQSDEFIAKAKEIIGEDKVDEIEKALFKDKLKKDSENSDNQNPDRMQVKAGHYPIYDMTANYYTSGNRDTADALEKWIENQLLKFDRLDLEELHDHLEEPVLQTDQFLGWTSADNKGHSHVSVRLASSETPSGRLCYKMKFDPAPHSISKD